MFKRSIAVITLMLALAPRPASAQLLSGLVSGLLGTSTSSTTWTSPKADNAVEAKVQNNQSARVIVRYKPEYRTLVTTYVKSKTNTVNAEIRGANVVAATLSASAIKLVAAQSAVLTMSLDSQVKSSALLGLTVEPVVQPLEPVLEPVLEPALPLLPENPFYTFPSYDGQALRATLGVLPQNSGNGVGVAIVDSGIAPTADIAGRITAFYDFTGTGSAVATTPKDGYGHGTHIAGLIAGNGTNSNGKYVGVAMGARLIGLRVLDNQGEGFSSDVIEAIDFATTNKAALGIDVMNLSLGHPIYEPAATDPLVQAVERATRAGIVVVISAGNIGMNPTTGEIGYAGLTSPGNAPSALTVGSTRTKGTATRSDDEISMFSSRGPTWYDGFVKPDVIAPGQALFATAVPGSTLSLKPGVQELTNPNYIKLSGTSMAAGVASGVVALMIDANREDEGATSRLTPNTVKAILQFTAIPVVDEDPATPAIIEQGAGSINAAGAIALATAIDPAIPTGQPWLETGVEMFTTIAGETFQWGHHLVWGDNIVWGDSALNHLEAFGDNIVWGDNDNIVWGDNDNIVWGDSVSFEVNHLLETVGAWGDNIVWGDDDNIVWGDDDNIVWGDNDNMVWGDSLLTLLGL
jgi:serine protease AprX